MAPSLRYPAITVGTSAASAPPATIASARPRRMRSNAQPIASEPAAQAVAGAAVGPCMPLRRVTAATGEFVNASGIVNGLTRSAPRSRSASCASINVAAPPCAQPMLAPMRHPSSPNAPASASAFAAATAANMPTRSIRLISRRPSTASASTSGTVTAGSAGSPGNARVRTALRPANSASQNASTSLPSPVVRPRPVITTRRMGGV